MSILQGLENIQEYIFEYDINKVKSSIQGLIEKLMSLFKEADKDEVKILNEVFSYMNIALANKDYLLLADLIEYELAPFIKNEKRGWIYDWFISEKFIVF